MRNTSFSLAVATALFALTSASRAAEAAAPSAPAAPPATNPAGDSALRHADFDPSNGSAVEGDPAGGSVLRHFDVEVDPIAYVARGHSLHLGFRFSRLRFDVGSFSLVVPEFVHGQEGFEDWGSGYGIKLDAYLLEAGQGPFVGAEGAWFEQEIVESSSDTRREVSSFMAGGRVGWELELGAGFYARPWVGLSYRFGNDTVKLANGTFRQSPFVVFPTVHLGYIFH